MKVDQLKKHVNTLTSVTISEVRSQLHRMEHTMEDHLGRIPIFEGFIYSAPLLVFTFLHSFSVFFPLFSLFFHSFSFFFLFLHLVILYIQFFLVFPLLL